MLIRIVRFCRSTKLVAPGNRPRRADPRGAAGEQALAAFALGRRLLFGAESTLSHSRELKGPVRTAAHFPLRDPLVWVKLFAPLGN